MVRGSSSSETFSTNSSTSTCRWSRVALWLVVPLTVAVLLYFVCDFNAAAHPNTITSTTTSTDNDDPQCDLFASIKAQVSAMFARVTFIPTLVYNVVLEKVTARRWYDRIDNSIILGALPFRHMADNLVQNESLKGVVSMNEDYELKFGAMDGPRWASKGVKFLQLPTTDIFETPDQGKLIAGLKFINNFLEDAEKIPELGKTTDDPNHPKGTVYIHCKAGRTRSATLVGCYLIKKYNLTPAEAVKWMAEKRPHIFMRSAQLRALDIFYENQKRNE